MCQPSCFSPIYITVTKVRLEGEIVWYLSDVGLDQYLGIPCCVSMLNLMLSVIDINGQTKGHEKQINLLGSNYVSKL